jgi:hypothetical protein
MKLPVPLCSDHARPARCKSTAQAWCERVAGAGGILVALAAAARLFLYWQQTGQGQPGWTLPLALAVGASLGVTFWAIVAFWIAPLLASKETKTVLRSLQMTHYDPFRNRLEVKFANDTYAELTARRNLSLLDIDKLGLKHYHLEAAIRSDDVRLVGSLRSDVLLDHPPAEAEARNLLEPEAQMVMVQHAGVGCFYDVYVTGIEEILPP